MSETSESLPIKDPRAELADTLRDFFLQGLVQEATIREQAISGRNIAKGSLIKTDGPYLKIRLDVPSVDKDFSRDPYLLDQPDSELVLSEEDRLFLQTILSFPTIWALVLQNPQNLPEDTEGLAPFELAVIYSEEVTLHIEGPDNETIIISDSSFSSSADTPDNLDDWGKTEKETQKHRAALLNQVLTEYYNLRTVGGGPVNDISNSA